MAGTVKGITIEFNGDVTKLATAMSQIKREANSVDRSLRQVNTALKFNPGNVELLTQKQSLMRQKVDATKRSLKQLKDAQKQLDANGIDKNSAEYQKLRREIIQTESKLKTFNAEMLKINAALSPLGQAGTKMTALGKSAGDLSSKLKGVSTAALVVAAGIGMLAYKAGVAADDLNTMSHQYGINTKDLQNYQSTADLVDVSVETLAKTHVKLKKNMMTASQSASGSAAKAFDALGIKVKGSNGHLRDGNVVYDECIAKLAGMKNETERDAYAMRIFGKSAADLNPLLEGGAEQYQKFTDLMKANGLNPVTQEQLDKANKFNDAIDTIKATFSRVVLIIGTKIAGYLGPLLESLSEKFAAVAGVIAGMSGKTLSVIGGIASAIAVLAPAVFIFSKISTGMGAMLTTMSQLILKVPLLGKAFTLISANPIILVIAALVALSAEIGASGISADELSAKISGLINGIVAMIPSIVTGLIAGFTTVVTVLPNLITAIVTGFTTLLTALVQALPTILPALVNGFVQLIIAIANMLPTMIPTLMTAAVQLFMALVTAIPTIVVALIKALPQIVKAFRTGLQQQLPKIWDQIKNTAVGKFITMVAKIGSTIAKVYDKITSPFKKALAFIKKVVDKIEDFFHGMKLSLPHIKLPHFSIKGKFSLKDMTVPHLSIDWYKNGAIFTSPTLLGNKGVGEAGAEAALPLSSLWDQMDKQNSALIQALVGALGIDYDKLASAMADAITGTSVAVDGRQFGRLVRKGAAGTI